MISLTSRLLGAYAVLCLLEIIAFYSIMSMLQEIIFIQTKNQTLDSLDQDVTKVPMFSGLTMFIVNLLSAANVIISFTTIFGNIYSRKMNADVKSCTGVHFFNTVHQLWNLFKVVFLLLLLYKLRNEAVPVLGTYNFVSLMVVFTVYECLHAVILRALLVNLQNVSKDDFLEDREAMYKPLGTEDWDEYESDEEVLFKH